MAKLAGDMRDLLLKRVRAYGGIAFDDDWVRTLLSLCERTVNSGLRTVLATTSVTTVAEQTLYNLRSDFSDALYDAIEIVQVTHTDVDGTYELRRATIADLFGYSATWFRDAATTRYHWYAQLGRDLLIVYPAFDSAKTLSVTYSKQTTALSADATTMDTSDEDVPIVLDLAEIVLLLTLRITEVTKTKVENLQMKLSAEAGSR